MNHRAAEVPNDWVNTKDRLPEKPGRYEVIVRNDDGSTRRDVFYFGVCESSLSGRGTPPGLQPRLTIVEWKEVSESGEKHVR